TFAGVSLIEAEHALVDTYAVDEDLARKDPLVVFPIAKLTASLKLRIADNAKLLPPLRDPLSVDLAPALDAKYDPDREFEAHEPWRARLPDGGMDAELTDAGGAWFVDLLRAHVERGGFRHADHAPTIELLTEGYEPF